MSKSDFVGDWRLLGIISPLFNEWQRFPNSTNSYNSLIRLTYHGEHARITSKGFLRAVYTTPKLNYGTWLRFYPKAEAEVLTYPAPSELLYTSKAVTRYFEVCKRNRGYPAYYRTRDTVWSVTLEALEVNFSVHEREAKLIDSLVTNESGQPVTDNDGNIIHL